MRVFALKSCDTCRKALSDLRGAGHVPQVIDIRADGISDLDLNQILTQFGDAAINRASTTWRGLTEVERDMPPADLLTAHPTLLKRPAIDRAGVWTIGWSPAVQAQVLA